MLIGKAYKTLGPNVGKGAYSKTYLALGPDGRKVVIKLPNLDRNQPHIVLEKRVDEFNKSLDKEYQCLCHLTSVKCVAHALDIGKHSMKVRGYEFLPSFIVQEYVPGQDLHEYLNGRGFRRFAFLHKGRFSGINEIKRFFKLASGITLALAQIHRKEVVHGDLWPPNIRIGLDRNPVIIDFGQSLLVDLALLAGAEPLSHPYAAPERRIGKWGAAADIYSLGGVLFFMATGQDPPQPILDWDQLKSTVSDQIKKRNPGLYAGNSGIADVIARCLRYDDRDRPSYAEGVWEELNIYLTPPRQRSPELGEAVKSLGASIKRLGKRNIAVFAHIASARVRTLERQFQDMSHGLYTLGGHYENISRGLVESLSLLDRRDTYLTVTVPSFWGKNGLGRNGRFLEMNKVVAQRGVNIGRVFLLTPEDTQSEYVRDILEAQFRVVQELAAESPAVSIEKWSALGRPRGYYVGVHKLLEAAELEEFEFTNFGIWSKAGMDQDVLVIPAYRERGTHIAAVRFWAPLVARDRIVELKQVAMQLIGDSTPLTEFLQSSRKRSSTRRRQDRRRESSRVCADQRQLVEIDWERRPQKHVERIENMPAKVRDYSVNGLSLAFALPLNRTPAEGDLVRLSGQAPFAGDWARRLWGQALRVRWKKISSEPSPAHCVIGLQRKA